MRRRTKVSLALLVFAFVGALITSQLFTGFSARGQNPEAAKAKMDAKGVIRPADFLGPFPITVPSGLKIPTWGRTIVSKEELNISADQPVVLSIKDRETGRIIGEQWYIAQPEVKAGRRDYPELRYKYGDLLKVEAGGCVQTGGSGSTCKDYVNPKGPNSERLYSGLIWLPGASPSSPASAGLVRIGKVLQEIPVSVKPSHGDDTNYHLHLGYEDDDYTDNGYYAMDSGTEGHCNGVGWAWVRVTVLFGYASAAPQRPKAPMDLWWDEIDDNGIPLNPKWGLQVTSGINPDASTLCSHFSESQTHGCTTWSPTIDTPGLISVCSLGSVPGVGHVPVNAPHGHINWGYATYEGEIYFEDFSVWPGDGDYNLELVRPDQAGVTAGNSTRPSGSLVALDLEFDSSETIDHFDLTWWNDFHQAVDKGAGLLSIGSDWTEARKMVHGQEAIVIGLIGLDNEHDAKAELHPVYGLAIHTESSSDQDVWQVFAHNFGNQGSCSQNQHYFPQNTIKFFFKEAAGLVEASTVVHATNAAGTSWSSSVLADGVIVAFNLPEPQSKVVVHGEIHLQRKRGIPSYKGQSYSPKNEFHRQLFQRLTREKEEGNAVWEKVLQAMDPVKRQKFLESARFAQLQKSQESRRNSVAVVKAAQNLTSTRKKLETKDIPEPTKLNSTAKALEPFDQALEDHRVKMFGILQDTLGNQDAFVELLKQVSESHPAGDSTRSHHE